MIERTGKVFLVAAIAFFFSVVIFNNLTDYATNFAYVQHVLSMDTIFPDSTLKWRAITNPTMHHLAFAGIIGWEIAIAILCWVGVVQMGLALSLERELFQPAKRYALAGLILGCLLWLVAFLAIAGEWFAMWQSPTWNGQPIASRMFVITGMVLLLVQQSDQ